MFFATRSLIHPTTDNLRTLHWNMRSIRMLFSSCLQVGDFMRKIIKTSINAFSTSVRLANAIVGQNI